MSLSEEEKIKLLPTFIGADLAQKKTRIKGKKLVAFAKSVFDENPKYTKVGINSEGKPDYSEIVAHPSFPASFSANTGGPLYTMIDLKYPDGKPLVSNPGKLLHTGQKYDYRNCVPIKHGMTLITTGKISNLTAKAGILWLEFTLTSKNEKDELVVVITVNLGIRKGGW
ncbi:MAG: MaoC family dehydratase [archaeon]|nr:MaoC family dehydratase [archaeon]